MIFPAINFYLGMDQYLLIPFLMGWTSIYQLFWGSLGTRVLTHPHLTSSRFAFRVKSHALDGTVQFSRKKRSRSAINNTCQAEFRQDLLSDQTRHSPQSLLLAGILKAKTRHLLPVLQCPALTLPRVRRSCRGWHHPLLSQIIKHGSWVKSQTLFEPAKNVVCLTIKHGDE